LLQSLQHQLTTSNPHIAIISNQFTTNTTNPSTAANMQFSTLAIAAFAALASAAALKRAPIDLCPVLDTPQCCQVDVDGVTDLTCSARRSNSIAIIPKGNDLVR
jgi:hypothetical protein